MLRDADGGDYIARRVRPDKPSSRPRPPQSGGFRIPIVAEIAEHELPQPAPTSFRGSSFKPVPRPSITTRFILTIAASFHHTRRANIDSSNGSVESPGDAAWRFIGCRVTAAFLVDGTVVDANDLVLGGLIAGSDRKVAAKIVDLDPEQQLVSEIWGLEMRICDAAGTTWLSGRFEPVGFMDIWDRSIGKWQRD